MQIILLWTLLNFGFNHDSILIRAGDNSQEVEKFVVTSEQKGYKNWAEFFLASMPDIDLVNLKSDEFINYFDALKKNYERVAWKNKLNNNLFYHYILSHRVSQEPLENFTEIYADTLYNLINKTKNMRNAVLRINEWVYTNVIYEPTERWDQNAITTIKRGVGRCEELSILLIKALRTVCIPARHTYTPWWSHTNSNHAWVEVWTGDKWHYIGAAELSNLDNTWFTQNAKRAPIIKTTAYGKQTDRKEIIDRSEDNYSIINATQNYGDAVKLNIRIMENNLPVESSSVSINIYNYASLVPVGLKKTDNNGYVHWVTGKTDLFIYANKGSQIGYHIWKSSGKNNDTVTISLSKIEIPDTSFWLYTHKVADQSKKSTYKPDTKLLNALRDINIDKLNIVDSTLVITLNSLDTNLAKTISNAKANGQALLQFYLNLPDLTKPVYIKYCNNLVVKDLISLDTFGLFQELTAVQRALSLCDRNTPDTIIHNYILSPRILYEQFNHWRFFIQANIDEILPVQQVPKIVISTKAKVDSIFNWITENIQLKKEGDAFGPMMNPQDVYKTKRATKLEHYVFIVGALRSIGIPSRIKWSEDAVEYWDGKWQEKSFEQKKERENLWVGLKFEANDINVTDKTEYYEDYSITRFKESPIRLEPPLDTLDGYVIITLDDNPSYVITGWRNGFGDSYIKIKRIFPSTDTAKYIVNMDIPENVKPGDLIVREYNGLTGLDKYNINSKDLEKGDVLTIIFDVTGVVNVMNPLDAWGVTNKGYGRGEGKDIHLKWGVKDLPSIIYLRDGKCLFWVEGLNLHL